MEENITTKLKLNIGNYNNNFYYENLFALIDCDDYNLSLIYNKFYNSIKIKHKSKIVTSKKKSEFNHSRKEICILGVLCNDEGMKIEKSLLNWLIPEYDVYCVYQKYPGILYEYPALRFAQWFSQVYNISIILYVHTKGAYNKGEHQEITRALWKHEFTKNNKKKYIQLLNNNFCDVALPFRFGSSTFFNGMFISKRAFNLINEIDYYPNNRWHYESLFRKTNKLNFSIRLKGVISDNILPNQLYSEIKRILNKSERKPIILGKVAIILTFEVFLFYLKVINLTKIRLTRK